MPEAAPSKSSKVLPLIRYRDPRSAVAWLLEAFGFETRCLVSRVDGSFAYAHLAFGDNLIMVTPAPDAQPDRPAPEPEKPAIDGRYFVVDDIEAHFARAKAGGAEILSEIAADDHGGRRYTCRDPDGHVWTFGTYDPAREPRSARARPRLAWLPGRPSHRAGLAAAAALTIVILVVPLWRLQSTPQRPVAAAPSEPATTEPVREAAGPSPEEAAARAALEQVRSELAEERAARRSAEAAEHTALAELNQERAARQEAERPSGNLKAELAEERAARQSAEAAEHAALAELNQERIARQEAERSSENLKAELAAARSTRAAAEQIARDLDDHLAHDTRAAHSIGESPTSAERTPEAPAVKAALVSTPPPEPLTLPSIPVLAEAQAALAKGEIERARKLLRKLAEDGVPEAALALGSTYDPANVERAGMGSAYADRAQAKQWYRRAIELAGTERRPVR